MHGQENQEYAPGGAYFWLGRIFGKLRTPTYCYVAVYAKLCLKQKLSFEVFIPIIFCSVSDGVTDFQFFPFRTGLLATCSRDDKVRTVQILGQRLND